MSASSGISVFLNRPERVARKRLLLIATGAFLAGALAPRVFKFVRAIVSKASPVQEEEKHTDTSFPQWVKHLVNHDFSRIDPGMPEFLQLCADVGASQVSYPRCNGFARRR
jgi:hypothetical protein